MRYYGKILLDVKKQQRKMKMTADDLYKLKVIDKIIREPKEVNDISFKKLAQDMKKEIKIIL